MGRFAVIIKSPDKELRSERLHEPSARHVPVHGHAEALATGVSRLPARFRLFRLFKLIKGLKYGH